MFTQPLKLPVCFYSEESAQLQRLGLGDTDNVDDTEIRYGYFYEVSAVIEFPDNDNYTVVVSGGMEFVVFMKMQKLVEVINTHVKTHHI